MAFDGIVIAALAHELNTKLSGGKIAKIAQPENDELLFTIKNGRETYRLNMSACASLPFVYLTDKNKPSPVTAPAFCMMLRKHIANGRIISVKQYGLERILSLEVEHLNEMGDLCRKELIIELMGKYSNIIFCNTEHMILDSIKHVSANISSLREVLPGRTWFLPDELKKADPYTVSEEEFYSLVSEKPVPCFKALYQTFSGFSPLIANELMNRTGIDSQLSANVLSETEKTHLYHQFALFMNDLKEKHFDPVIYYKNGEPQEFSAIDLTGFKDCEACHEESMSSVLEKYYAEKNLATRMHTKSADLRKITTTLLERNRKKLELQEKQMKDTEKREQYRLYGELLTAYGYQYEKPEKKIIVSNYYDDNKEITINLDAEISVLDNAKKYYAKYNKAKRMFEALTIQIAETKNEIYHLESVEVEISMARDENDLNVIKQEMHQAGYIRKALGRKKGEKMPAAGKPLHYVTEDGYHIYVGRNNFQNEALTFEFADGKDMWFHAKNVPGSHVIVKCNGDELPDHIYEIAAALAAFYSKGKDNDKCEVDYIQRKFVKKTPGGKPGFVIYHTNYSMIVKPEIAHVSLVP